MIARRNFDPPSPLLFGLESLSIFERGIFSVFGQYFIPPCTNEANPTLVLPGFTASDQSTRLLRRVLRDKGYPVHGWGLGSNIGPHPHVLDGLRRRLAELCDRYSLVGEPRRMEPRWDLRAGDGSGSSGAGAARRHAREPVSVPHR